MGTRGSLIIESKRYYIKCDAYPEYGREVLKAALRLYQSSKIPYSIEGFIKIVNIIAGHNWIDGIAPEEFNYPFEEYRYFADLDKKTLKVENMKGEKPFP